MHALAILACLATAGLQTAPPQADTAPVVSVWYRGTPPGVPKLDDLVALRTMGFVSVTWPANQGAGLPDLRRLAASVDLAVAVLAADDSSALPVPALEPHLTPTIWRTIARGARVITLDPGQTEGTGMTARGGAVLPWVRPAAAAARTVSANPRLIAALRPGPAVIAEAPISKDVEVVLLDADRGWVLIATSTAPGPQKVVARLPPGVPYALWVSLLDGSTMSMLRQSSGPRWTFTIAAGDALVYVIDKTLK